MTRIPKQWRSSTCSCGSGKPKSAQYDARGIFLTYTCEDCHDRKMAGYRSSARPRGSAGPIRAEPLYCQFDLPVRRRPIGSYEVFFVLCHLVPDNLNVRRASRARKLALPPRNEKIKRKVPQELILCSRKRLNAHHRAIPRP